MACPGGRREHDGRLVRRSDVAAGFFGDEDELRTRYVWNPAVEDQATDRAHRIGQTRPVTVIRLIAQGTIEEAVLSLHDEKRQLADSILDGTAAAGKLSIAELGALIRAPLSE